MTENTQNENLKKTGQVAEKILKNTGKAVLWTGKNIRSILGTAALAGVTALGVYTHKQMHKTPEQAHEDTIKMEKKAKETIQADVDKMWETTNDASVVKKAVKTTSSEIVGAGVRFGGALREWIVRRNNKNK